MDILKQIIMKIVSSGMNHIGKQTNLTIWMKQKNHRRNPSIRKLLTKGLKIS